MSRNHALNGFLAACSLLILAASILIVRRASMSDVPGDSSVARPSSRETELEQALHQRDSEIDALRADVSRLKMLLDDERKPAEPIVAEATESLAPLVKATSRDAATGLAAAVNLLRTAAPERFGELSAEEAAALTELDLRGVKITDEDLALLAALLALQTLSLRGTEVTDAGLAYLRGAPQLAALDLRGTQVTGAGVGQLSALGLTALHLTDTRVTGADLHWLPAMPNLQTLKLNRLEFGDDAIRDLALFPSVKHLELDGTAITNAGLGQLLAQNTSLERIELRSTPVTREAVEELRSAYPNVAFVLDEPSITAHYGR